MTLCEKRETGNVPAAGSRIPDFKAGGQNTQFVLLPNPPAERRVNETIIKRRICEIVYGLPKGMTIHTEILAGVMDAEFPKNGISGRGIGYLKYLFEDELLKTSEIKARIRGLDGSPPDKHEEVVAAISYAAAEGPRTYELLLDGRIEKIALDPISKQEAGLEAVETFGRLLLARYPEITQPKCAEILRIKFPHDRTAAIADALYRKRVISTLSRISPSELLPDPEGPSLWEMAQANTRGKK